jgi:hypothetical protein
MAWIVLPRPMSSAIRQRPARGLARARRFPGCRAAGLRRFAGTFFSCFHRTGRLPIGVDNASIPALNMLSSSACHVTAFRLNPSSRIDAGSVVLRHESQRPKNRMDGKRRSHGQSMAVNEMVFDGLVLREHDKKPPGRTRATECRSRG